VYQFIILPTFHNQTSLTTQKFPEISTSPWVCFAPPLNPCRILQCFRVSSNYGYSKHDYSASRLPDLKWASAFQLAVSHSAADETFDARNRISRMLHHVLLGCKSHQLNVCTTDKNDKWEQMVCNLKKSLRCQNHTSFFTEKKTQHTSIPFQHYL